MPSPSVPTRRSSSSLETGSSDGTVRLPSDSHLSRRFATATATNILRHTCTHNQINNQATSVTQRTTGAKHSEHSSRAPELGEDCIDGATCLAKRAPTHLFSSIASGTPLRECVPSLGRAGGASLGRASSVPQRHPRRPLARCYAFDRVNSALHTRAVGPNPNPGWRDWLSARGAAEPASQSQRRCVVWHLERCEASLCASVPPHPTLVAMSPTLPMLTTDRSQKAAGRRLRIVHDGHRSARPHRRRHPHLIKRTEISTRSNEQSKMRGCGRVVAAR